MQTYLAQDVKNWRFDYHYLAGKTTSKNTCNCVLPLLKPGDKSTIDFLASAQKQKSFENNLLVIKSMKDM